MPLTHADRFPWIDAPAEALLKRLVEHPNRPRYSAESGDRLTEGLIAELKTYAAATGLPDWGLPDWGLPDRGLPDWGLPDWLPAFVDHCLAQVPAYRDRVETGTPFRDIAPTDRALLARAPWDLVPDDQPLDDVITYTTSGTTGAPMSMPSSPLAASRYLVLLDRALALHGRRLARGSDRVAIAQVHAQRGTLTYATLSGFLGGAGAVKINLDPAAWTDPSDPVRFLDDIRPSVVFGDPVALAALAALPLDHRPDTLASSAMTLSAGMRARLEQQFACPVVDLYSMTEARLIAAWHDGAHVLLADDLHVEILDPSGHPVSVGDRGEIALTGGHNPHLPLLRYLTGDTARLIRDRHGRLALADLDGRRPVVLRDAGGRLVNAIDIARALSPLALPRYQVRQDADRRVTLAIDAEYRMLAPAALTALAPLFGDLLELEWLALPDDERKVAPVVGAAAFLEPEEAG